MLAKGESKGKMQTEDMGEPYVGQKKGEESKWGSRN